jgi:hypothetical protein
VLLCHHSASHDRFSFSVLGEQLVHAGPNFWEGRVAAAPERSRRRVARADAEAPRWYLLPAGHLVAVLC